MAFEDTRIQLESRFSDNWPHTSIKWPNVKLDTSVLDEWVCFNNVPDESKLAQSGDTINVNRYFGIVVIQIFVSPNIGLLRAKILSDHIADIWRTNQFSGITFETPEIVEVGILDGWYQLNVNNEYSRSSYEAISTL